MLLVGWVGYMSLGWAQNEQWEKTERGEINRRVISTELSLADATQSWMPLLRWAVGSEDLAGLLDDSIDYLSQLDQKSGLEGGEWQISQSLKVLAASDQDRAEVMGNSGLVYEDFALGETYWEVRLLEEFSGDRLGSATKLEAFREKQSKLVNRVVWFALVGWTVFVIGLLFVRRVVRNYSLEPAWKQPLPLRLWPLSMVLMVYCLSVVFELVILWGGYGMIGLMLSEWSISVNFLMDSLWRVTAAVTFMMLLFARPSHAVKVLGCFRRVHWRLLVSMMVLMGLYDAALYYLFDWLKLVDWTEGLDLTGDGLLGLFGMVLSGVILAPVCEEIVYRGGLFNGFLRRFSFWPAALLSSSFFAAIHFYDVYGCLSVYGFGVASCMLYRATGSLSTSIVFHALNNVMYFLYAWLLYNEPYS